MASSRRRPAVKSGGRLTTDNGCRESSRPGAGTDQQNGKSFWRRGKGMAGLGRAGQGWGSTCMAMMACRTQREVARCAHGWCTTHIISLLFEPPLGATVPRCHGATMILYVSIKTEHVRPAVTQAVQPSSAGVHLGSPSTAGVCNKINCVCSVRYTV